jgi:uncharacterized membrane protein
MMSKQFFTISFYLIKQFSISKYILIKIKIFPLRAGFFTAPGASQIMWFLILILLIFIIDKIIKKAKLLLTININNEEHCSLGNHWY